MSRGARKYTCQVTFMCSEQQLETLDRLAEQHRGGRAAALRELLDAAKRAENRATAPPPPKLPDLPPRVPVEVTEGGFSGEVGRLAEKLERPRVDFLSTIRGETDE